MKKEVKQEKIDSGTRNASKRAGTHHSAGSSNSSKKFLKTLSEEFEKEAEKDILKQAFEPPKSPLLDGGVIGEEGGNLNSLLGIPKPTIPGEEIGDLGALDGDR